MVGNFDSFSGNTPEKRLRPVQPAEILAEKKTGKITVGPFRRNQQPRTLPPPLPGQTESPLKTVGAEILQEIKPGKKAEFGKLKYRLPPLPENARARKETVAPRESDGIEVSEFDNFTLSRIYEKKNLDDRAEAERLTILAAENATKTNELATATEYAMFKALRLVSLSEKLAKAYHRLALFEQNTDPSLEKMLLTMKLDIQTLEEEYAEQSALMQAAKENIELENRPENIKQIIPEIEKQMRTLAQELDTLYIQVLNVSNGLMRHFRRAERAELEKATDAKLDAMRELNSRLTALITELNGFLPEEEKVLTPHDRERIFREKIHQNFAAADKEALEKKKKAATETKKNARYGGQTNNSPRVRL